VKQQLILSDKLELITGQSVHLFSEAATPYENPHNDISPAYIKDETAINSLENSMTRINN